MFFNFFFFFNFFSLDFSHVSDSSHSNIGGAWGTDHSAVLSREKQYVMVTKSEVGGDVTEQTINIKKLAIGDGVGDGAGVPQHNNVI